MALVYVGKNPANVMLPDGSVVAFMNDRLTKDPTAITITTVGGETLYSVSAMPVTDDRCLLFGVSTPSGTVPSANQSLRCCVYYNQTSGQSHVLREVISPQITYDNASNSLVMWFWTNFVDGFTGTDYDESQLKLISEDDFSTDDPVVRALCCAVGSVRKLNFSGGGAIDDNDGIDLVPVFMMPRIVQTRILPDPAATGGYAIIDFGGVGGGSIISVKFNNTGSGTIPFHGSLTNDMGYSSGMFSTDPDVLALKKSDIDVPAISYICLTKDGVAAGEEGAAGYLMGPYWTKINVISTIAAGMVVGVYKDSDYLTTDVPGYRVLATKVDDDLGRMAFITPDHRPTLMRARVAPDSETGMARVVTNTGGVGGVDIETNIIPPP